jgi:hypothetical protein
VAFDGLVIGAARKVGAAIMIRGLRDPPGGPPRRPRNRMIQSDRNLLSPTARKSRLIFGKHDAQIQSFGAFLARPNGRAALYCSG